MMDYHSIFISSDDDTLRIFNDTVVLSEDTIFGDSNDDDNDNGNALDIFNDMITPYLSEWNSSNSHDDVVCVYVVVCRILF